MQASWVKRNAGILYAMGTSFMWGILAIKLKYALKFLDPFSIVWFRFSVAFVLLAAYLLFKRRPLIGGIKALPFFGTVTAALLIAVNYYTYLLGVKYTGAANAQIVIQLGPLLLVLGRVFIFKEKVTARQLLGLVILAGGFSLFYLDRRSNGGTGAAQLNWGTGIIAIAALFWAVYALIQKRILQKAGESQFFNLFVYLVCTLCYLPFVRFSSFAQLSALQYSVLFLLGLNTLLAYGFMAEAITRIPANQAGVIFAMNPLITIGVSIFFDTFSITWVSAENVGPLGVVGALIFLLGAGLFIYYGRSGQTR